MTVSNRTLPPAQRKASNGLFKTRCWRRVFRRVLVITRRQETRVQDVGRVESGGSGGLAVIINIAQKLPRSLVLLVRCCAPSQGWPEVKPHGSQHLSRYGAIARRNRFGGKIEARLASPKIPDGKIAIRGSHIRFQSPIGPRWISDRIWQSNTFELEPVFRRDGCGLPSTSRKQKLGNEEKSEAQFAKGRYYVGSPATTKANPPSSRPRRGASKNSRLASQKAGCHA